LNVERPVVTLWRRSLSCLSTHRKHELQRYQRNGEGCASFVRPRQSSSYENLHHKQKQSGRRASLL